MNENDIQNNNKIDESQAEEMTQPAEEDVQVEEEQAAEDNLNEEVSEEPQMDEPAEKSKKHMKTGAVVAITAAATVAICAIVLFVCSKFFYNPYNAKCKYVETIKDYADAGSMSVEEFKKSYQLPADMPGNTYVVVANMYLPVSYLAESNGAEFQAFIDSIGLPEEYASKIKPETTYGELMEMIDKANSSTTEGN